MIIDTHAHYDDEAFSKDREQVLSELKKNGVEVVINAAASMESCRQTLALTKAYSFIYGMQGIHPDDVGRLTEQDMNFLREHAIDEKIVAIGEIGLDYHWNVETKDVQKYWFKRQLELARELKLPVCIHSRDAAADTLEILQQADAGSIGGVIHCYSYSAEMAKEFLSMGFYFGIGGVVTFKNSRKCKETVEMLPIEKILLETDAPYLAPEPYRGKRNNSVFLFHVAETIAEIKGMPAREVIEITAQNAGQLYKKIKMI